MGTRVGLPGTGDTGRLAGARLAWFSDALVGVVATLLIADLVGHLADLPSQAAGDPDAVVSVWIGEHVWFVPAHLLSFVVLYFAWRRHREIFRHLKGVDRTQLWLNAGFLATLCLFPFATSLVARSQASEPAMLVFLVTAAATLVWLVLLLVTSRRSGLILDDRPEVMGPLTLYVAGPLVAVLAGVGIVLVGSWLQLPPVGLVAIVVIVLLNLALLGVMNRRLGRSPATQPSGADLAIDGSHDPHVMPQASSLSPIGRFFEGSAVDRSLLLTDGVYAIAVTIMAVLLVPTADGSHGTDIGAELTGAFAWDEGPSNFWLFLVLFAAVYRIWLLHVRTFRLVDDIGILGEWANGIHLLLIAWVPIAFGLMIAAPPGAALPWWILTVALLLVLGSVLVLGWIVLIRDRAESAAGVQTMRLLVSRSGVDALATCIILAPLGLPLIGIVPALLQDPLVNLLWRRGPHAPRRSVRTVMFDDPAQGLGASLNPLGVIVMMVIVLCACALAWRLNGFFLVRG